MGTLGDLTASLDLDMDTLRSKVSWADTVSDYYAPSCNIVSVWLDDDKLKSNGLETIKKDDSGMVGWRWIGKMGKEMKIETHLQTDEDMWPAKFKITVLADSSVLVSDQCPDYYILEPDEILGILNSCVTDYGGGKETKSGWDNDYLNQKLGDPNQWYYYGGTGTGAGIPNWVSYNGSGANSTTWTTTTTC